MKINKSLEQLKQRVLDISYKHKLSHIGSCITAIEIIREIYSEMSENDIFILSCQRLLRYSIVIINR